MCFEADPSEIEMCLYHFEHYIHYTCRATFGTLCTLDKPVLPSMFPALTIVGCSILWRLLPHVYIGSFDLPISCFPMQLRILCDPRHQTLGHTIFN